MGNFINGSAAAIIPAEVSANVWSIVFAYLDQLFIASLDLTVRRTHQGTPGDATAFTIERAVGGYSNTLAVNALVRPTGDFVVQIASTDLRQERIRPSTLVPDGRCDPFAL